MKTTFIYALCEPGTRTVRYIGKADNPRTRLDKHLSYSRNSTNHLGRWLSSLRSKGVRPELVILREVPQGDWKIAEMRFIRLARGCRMDLVNGNDGGEGGSNPTQETRDKLRLCKSGRNHPLHGTHLSEGHRKAIGDSLRGRKLPPRALEHSSAISAAKKGVSQTLGHRLKNSIANSGPRNPMFGKPSPNKGVPRSLETRKRMSVAAKLRWEIRRESK